MKKLAHTDSEKMKMVVKYANVNIKSLVHQWILVINSVSMDSRSVGQAVPNADVKDVPH